MSLANLEEYEGENGYKHSNKHKHGYCEYVSNLSKDRAFCDDIYTCNAVNKLVLIIISFTNSLMEDFLKSKLKMHVHRRIMILEGLFW